MEQVLHTVEHKQVPSKSTDPGCMDPRFQNYHSYLLRLWQVGEGWRASLENVETGELQGFSELAALIDYLEKQAFAKKVDDTDLPID